MFLFVSEKQYECFETANRCVDADPGGTNLVCNGENDCGSFEVNISQFITWGGGKKFGSTNQAFLSQKYQVFFWKNWSYLIKFNW